MSAPTRLQGRAEEESWIQTHDHQEPEGSSFGQCRKKESGRHAWAYVHIEGAPPKLSDCDRPVQLKCAWCSTVVAVRCNRSSSAKCAPCGRRYRGRVRRIFASGWTDRPADRVFFVTMTAPGVDQHLNRWGAICECTPEGGVNLAEWHSTMGQRWSWFLTDLRRKFGDVEYAKAAEVQKRGALHFHVLIRCDGDLVAQKETLRRLAIRWGFGHSFDVQPANHSHAYYCAKYASKTCDDRGQVAWLDRSTGEIVDGAPRLRVWTSSRAWGSTMKAVRAEQRAWASAGAAGGRAAEPPGPDGPAQAAPAASLDLNTESYAASVAESGGLVFVVENLARDSVGDGSEHGSCA